MAVFVFSILFSLTFQSFSADPEPRDQFDFWIGAWDVNLRMIQPDNTWEDRIQSTAHIYKILDGKAILELWDHHVDGIIGYSLRYYNPNTEKWDLWLNWPSKNMSGTSMLSGSFRHGRGEFFSERMNPDSSITISRFTFSDISENKFRWDDGFSSDGGKTWTANWIMEFNRTAELAPEIGHKNSLLTYYEGKRCDNESFSIIHGLVGNHKDFNGNHMKVYDVLDGCMVMGFIDNGLFYTLTYNGYASVYELSVIDSIQENPLWMYYGSKEGNTISLIHREGEEQHAATLVLGEENSLSISYMGKTYLFSK